ncbi:GTPase IMAP family member 2-like [Halichoeres trimaculatus]|uniref:GTPase IMAP family member 2-like n=1 Tax=Halichoeres trimaculatus TaxID=147232 RepID=UPI003D9F658C
MGGASSKPGSPCSPTDLSRSFEFLPPDMSELRVALLGRSWSEKSSVGNFILGKTAFDTGREPPDCQKERGCIKRKDIVLVNTPDDVFLRLLTEQSLLRRHTDPGPHVLLLVVQPEDFTEEYKRWFCRLLENLSDRSYHHSLILISTPRSERPGFMETYRQDPNIKEMIRKCQFRYLWRKDLELQEMLMRFNEIVKENNGEPLRLR